METIVAAANELVVFNEVAIVLDKFEAKNENLVFDYATPEGEKEARSHIATLRTFKTLISKAHKEAKAEALAFGRRVDGRKNELTAKVKKWIAVHKDPLDLIEADKQAVIDAEKRKFEREEERRLLDLHAREQAVIAAEENIAREKAKAERVEREKRIAEEAAETAAAFERQRARNEADTKELDEKNRIEAAQAKEQRRVANKKHRAKIEADILVCLKRIGLDDEMAIRILSAIIDDNGIPHVSIQY